MSDLLKNLNKEQKEAVTHSDGPLLIVAGAGTGKTTILVNRLQYLFENKIAKPEEVLLVTFTEKAASEMEDRALKLLPYGYFDLWINTFHSFCERVLREHALDIGISSDFKLLSQTEQWILIKKNIKRFDLDYYQPVGTPDKFIEELVRHFSRLKDEDIRPGEYLDYAKKIQLSAIDGTEEEDKQEVARISELARAYEVYSQILHEEKYLDFGDLITETIRLFKSRPNISKIYKEKFKYIMVDEFQDTNWAQYELIKVLAAPENNLMVVGDDDQSVYKFRGASLSNIMQFKDDYPNAREIVLTNNYRSGQAILDIAHEFIKHNNPNRLEAKLEIDKKLHSQVETKGRVSYYSFEKEEEELSWVAEEILKIRDSKKAQWSDFAILTRSNNAAEKILEELKIKNIPRLFYSSKGLYHKPVIMDIMAYFRLLDNYHESSALFRVLNMSEFKIEHSEIITINKFARRKVLSLFEALKSVNTIPGLKTEIKNTVARLLALIDQHSIIAQKESPSRVYIRFVRESGIIEDKDFHRDKDFFNILNQFYKKIKSFETLESDPRLKDFVELINMEMRAGETGSLTLDLEDDDVVKIMTTHASKGLEFDYIFLPGLVDKRFPTINRKEKIPIPDAIVREKIPAGKNIHLEEERRLFYVALTRGKKQVFLTGAKDCGGKTSKKPSIFIKEAGLNVQTKEVGVETNELLHDLQDKEKVEKKEDKFILPNRLSFSQIEAFNNCPWQYRFNFILKIPVMPKANFIFGRVMHNTLREFLLPLITGNEIQGHLFLESTVSTEQLTLEGLLEIYKKQWQDDGYENKKTRDDYKKKGLDSLKLFYENLKAEGYPAVMLLEKPFTMKLAGYFFRGAIDRVDKLPDGTVEILDYKTGRPKEKLDYKSKKQLLLYKVALEEGMGLKVSQLSFYYLEGGTKVSFQPTEKLEEKFREDVLKTIEEMKKGQFIAKPSILCKYCDFNEICEFRKL